MRLLVDGARRSTAGPGTGHAGRTRRDEACQSVRSVNLGVESGVGPGLCSFGDVVVCCTRGEAGSVGPRRRPLASMEQGCKRA